MGDGRWEIGAWGARIEGRKSENGDWLPWARWRISRVLGGSTALGGLNQAGKDLSCIDCEDSCVIHWSCRIVVGDYTKKRSNFPARSPGNVVGLELLGKMGPLESLCYVGHYRNCRSSNLITQGEITSKSRLPCQRIDDIDKRPCAPPGIEVFKRHAGLGLLRAFWIRSSNFDLPSPISILPSPNFMTVRPCPPPFARRVGNRAIR